MLAEVRVSDSIFRSWPFIEIIFWAHVFIDVDCESKKPFDFSTKNETEFNHFLKNLTISCIHETPEGLIILGTSKGIKIYNLKQ